MNCTHWTSRWLDIFFVYISIISYAFDRLQITCLRPGETSDNHLSNSFKFITTYSYYSTLCLMQVWRGLKSTQKILKQLKLLTKFKCSPLQLLINFQNSYVTRKFICVRDLIYSIYTCRSIWTEIVWRFDRIYSESHSDVHIITVN